MDRTVVVVLGSDVLGRAHAGDVFRRVLGSDSRLSERIDTRVVPGDPGPEALSDAEIVACGSISDELVDAAPKLKWVSFWNAGMEAKARPALLDRGLILTNASGVHGPPIAEHLITMMLMFSRRMPLLMRRQLAGEWNRDFSHGEPGELTGQTLLIVGLGRIGEALAIRAKPFGMRIVGVKRDPAKRYDTEVYIDEVHGPDALPRLVGMADHVCIALPLTPETRGMIDSSLLARMKPSAYIYNIARGAIIDQQALIDTLSEGRLAGAGLDVFDPEPLPADSPLWQMPNVIVTPHVSGLTPFYFERAARLFADNLRRYLDGDTLSNLYDPSRGY